MWIWVQGSLFLRRFGDGGSLYSCDTGTVQEEDLYLCTTPMATENLRLSFSLFLLAHAYVYHFNVVGHQLAYLRKVLSNDHVHLEYG